MICRSAGQLVSSRIPRPHLSRAGIGGWERDCRQKVKGQRRALYEVERASVSVPLSLVVKMASYEPLDAIIDVPTVQEARSGEFYRVKSVKLLKINTQCMCCVVREHL